jgi:hypothetical protein
MTQWGIDTLFNPGKRHMDEEKRRLQSTREEVGDSSGGRRIDLESGTVTIPRRGKDGPPAEAGEAELDEADRTAESDEAELTADEAKPNADAAEPTADKAEPNADETVASDEAEPTADETVASDEAEPTADETVASDEAEAEPKTFGTGAQAAGIDLKH